MNIYTKTVLVIDTDNDSFEVGIGDGVDVTVVDGDSYLGDITEISPLSFKLKEYETEGNPIITIDYDKIEEIMEG